MVLRKVKFLIFGPQKSQNFDLHKKLWPSEKSNFFRNFKFPIPCISGYAQFFLHKKMTLRKWFTFFGTLRLFSKTILPNLRFWAQRIKKFVGSSPAQAVTPNFFAQKVMALGTVQFFFFRLFLELLEFSRRLLCQIELKVYS